MKRWHEEETRTKHECNKICKVENLGRFRKKKAFDCGNPRCQICHSDKYPKRDDTEQEIANKLRFKEQLKEL